MTLQRLYFFQTKLFFFIILFIFGAVIGGCKQNIGEYYPNAKPVVHLSNVPPDTLHGQKYVDTLAGPQLSLSWWANDPDGFVVGYRYRWTINSLIDPNNYHPYTFLLNIQANVVSTNPFTLIAVTQDPTLIPAVYHYFAINEVLDNGLLQHLQRGDSILIAGVKVFASNSDSILIPGTAVRDSNRFPVHVNPTSGNFVFESINAINLHIFSIEAIDNLGALSSPAEVSFTTKRLGAPQTFVQIHNNQDTSLIIEKKSDAFKGIQFDFSSLDSNSSYRSYQWVVDKDEWGVPDSLVPWTVFDPTPTAFVAGEDMPHPYETTHTMYVRAQNRFGLIDSTGASVQFNTFFPLFAKPPYPQKILLINNSLDSASQGLPYPSRQDVENYYTGLLNDLGDSYDIWEAGKDPPDGTGFPYLQDLQKYSLIIFVADRAMFDGEVKPQLSIARENRLIQYCDVGGNLILTGWSLRASYNVGLNSPFYQGIIHVSQSSNFNYNGILNASLIIPGSNLIGAQGQSNYPDIVWDQSKLDTSWHGGLPQQWLCFPDGFGEAIYRIQYNPSDSSYYTSGILTQTVYNGQPLAVRYIGGNPLGNPPGFFNTVFLSFPLYYVDATIAKQVLQQAISDVSKKNP